MELEEAQNNLRAMRLLYRLLEDSSLDQQNANPKDVSVLYFGVSLLLILGFSRRF